MPLHPLRTVTASLLLVLLIGACGGGEPGDESTDTDSADAVNASADAPLPAAAPAARVSPEASMTVEDIDRWQRGMQAELEAVRQAGLQLRSARTGTDSMSAIAAANETSTRAAGAKGAGIDEERYEVIGTAMSSIVRYMAPLETEMKVSEMPAEVVTMLRRTRDSSLTRALASFPPVVVDALRPRAAELRKLEMTLVGERLKAAGMGR